MAESDAGAAGMTEQLRRLFPDGNWPEFPYRAKSRRIAVDEDAATNLFVLFPQWGGSWHDFEPWLRESSNYPTSELPDLSVKTVCTAVGKAAQRDRDKRVSLGLLPIAAYGTSASSFVSVPLAAPRDPTIAAGEAVGAVLALGKTSAAEDVIESAAVLTDRRKTIVVAMLAMGAWDQRETLQKDAIQAALQYAGHDVGKSFASHSLALREADLIDSQNISPCGYWLTHKGKAVAEYICEKDRLFASLRVNLEKRWQQADLVTHKRSI